MSKYLPPFSAEERGTVAGGRSEWTPLEPEAAATAAVSEGEVTYADFLGDEVDE